MGQFTFQEGRLQRAKKIWSPDGDSGPTGRLYAVLVIAPLVQGDPAKTTNTVADLLALANVDPYPGFGAGSWPALPLITATRDDANNRVVFNSPGVIDFGSPAGTGGDPIHGLAIAYRVGASQADTDFLCLWNNDNIKGGNGTGGPMTITFPTNWMLDTD